MWTDQELEIYLQYQRFTNIYFEPIWINLDEELLQEHIKKLFHQLMQINKPVKVYKNSEFLYATVIWLIPDIKEEHSDSLITWIPTNFKDLESLGKWLENQALRETKLN